VVVREQCVVLGDPRLEVVEERAAPLRPPGGQVVVGAAEGEIAVRQPGAAGVLEQVEDVFAFAEGVQERAETAEVEPVGAHADEVRGDAVHLRDEDAKHLRLLGDLQPGKLFDREAEPEVHVHRGEVVHPVRVRDELDRGDVLADLLGAAVEVAEVRGDLAHDLAVGPQHQPQHPVRARVLRPHVDEHLVGADVELDDGRVGGRHGRVNLPTRGGDVRRRVGPPRRG
jgi:hypothetical protein